MLFDSAGWLSMIEAAERLLTDPERDRAARFAFAHDRATYVLAHACWRVTLGMVLGVPNDGIPLAMAPGGQPTLPGTGIATSLSHSGGWVALAIARASTVGIDIESTPPRAPLQPLAASICTPEEISDLGKLPTAERETALLALWTRKEALLKAFGCGLRTEPCSVSARAGEAVAAPLHAPVRTPCSVHNIELPAGLTGALATPADASFALRVYQLGRPAGIDTAICKAYAPTRSLRIKLERIQHHRGWGCFAF